MTDKEIIYNHLDKCFKPNIKVNSEDIHENLMDTKRYYNVQFINHSYNELNKKHLSEEALVKEMISTYGIEFIDEGEHMSYVVNDWLTNKLNNTFKDILDSLKQVKIVFGVRSWEVKRHDLDFDLNWLIKKHKDTCTKNIIIAVYHDWKHKEIIRISDEILNN
tara:strand:+ start:510 stop:998 length:489 start_codon:yes stop_codon:yes gene_type:complete